MYLLPMLCIKCTVLAKKEKKKQKKVGAKKNKKNSIESYNAKEKGFLSFGLFQQHEIYLIHAFVLCKFKPLPCYALRNICAQDHFRLHAQYMH
jgi:hypothetical protein